MRAMIRAGLAGTFLFPMTAIAQDAQGDSKFESCGQAFTYVITPPAADVPPGFRAFSGTWVGTWRGDLCGALIVEKINTDGRVETIYYRQYIIQTSQFVPSYNKSSVAEFYILWSLLLACCRDLDTWSTEPRILNENYRNS